MSPVVTAGKSTHGYSAAERRHLRALYERWKEEHCVGLVALADSDVLRRALRDLLETHGYGYSDVADWLGLSRERVRQHANAMGIDAPGVAMRAWDPEAARFVPTTAKGIAARRTELRGRRRREASARTKAAREKRIAEIVRAFAAARGRGPTLTELVRRIGLPHPAYLVHHLNMSRDSDYKRRLDELYAEAGCSRPDGRALRRLRQGARALRLEPEAVT